jgi:uncharacterized protein YutE (UPF0331/DUF86 family)
MKKLQLNKERIEERINIIENSYRSLSRFKNYRLEDFKKKQDNFRIAYYDLYTALESVLDIGAHILSRIPGKKPVSYKDIILFLSDEKIIPKDFCEDKLIKMAGYRNRMVHFYNRISQDEIYQIIQDHLDDFIEFNAYIKKVLTK